MESNNRSTEETTLLMLNDDCLIEILELLHPTDFANLAKTCVRLYNVALNVTVKLKEMEKIEFAVLKNMSSDEVTRSNKQFSDILSVFGGHVKSIQILGDGSDFIFQTIRDNCQNFIRLELFDAVKLPSQHFNNLRELKICGRVEVDFDEFITLLSNNPDIESLAVDGFNPNYLSGIEYSIFTCEFFEYLEILPKLKILELFNGRFSYEVIGLMNLLELPRLLHLTKLSLIEFVIEEGFLEELASKSNLLELELGWIDNTNAHAIKLFRNLEALHLDYDRCTDSNIFPEKLRFLRFTGNKTSCNQLIAIVKQLKFLEQFEIWYLTDDYLQSEIVSHLVNEIGERNLKIIYPNDDVGDEPYLYNSNHLQIIQNRFWPINKARKPVRVPAVAV